MEQTFKTFVSPAHCPYTIDGVKLIEMRKAKLLPYAESLGIAVDNTTGKSDLVAAMMERLHANGAPFELSELRAKAAKKKAKKKTS